MAREKVDAIVAVDGGTDSLMRGDEAGLGTPHEDVATLAALDALDVPRLLVCLGFGVDAFHGVCHAQFLENVADLAHTRAFLGPFSLLRDQEEAAAYLSLVAFATEHEPHRPSIVNTSTVSAVEGRFGNHHSISRTRGSELFINPLMAVQPKTRCSASSGVVSVSFEQLADGLRSTWPPTLMSTSRGP